jgi:hypothetical protein
LLEFGSGGGHAFPSLSEIGIGENPYWVTTYPDGKR